MNITILTIGSRGDVQPYVAPGCGLQAAGLAAGRPSVVVPCFADQHFWAWRAAALGAGPQPIRRRQISAERLAAAITEAVTTRMIQARAAALGERIRAEHGVRTVVALLQDLLPGETESPGRSHSPSSIALGARYTRP